MGMTRGAISGFVLMIVSAAGTWAVYGTPRQPSFAHQSNIKHLHVLHVSATAKLAKAPCTAHSLGFAPGV